MSNVNINKMKRYIAAYLVEKLMTLRACSRDDALELLMRTATYEALMDTDTDLYLESRYAVLEILNEELAGNPYRLLDVG